MAWKSPTEINATKGITEIFSYLNEVSNLWFGRMFILTVFAIFLFGYERVNRGDWIGGFAVASFITFLVALFSWIIGILSGIELGFVIGITVISAIALFIRNKQ